MSSALTPACSGRLLIAGLLCAMATRAPGANWPAWRGPNLDGISEETRGPLHWSRTENVRWRTPLAAPGNSSPIVWGNTVYLTEGTETRRRLIAYDRRNGRARWNTSLESRNPSPTTRQNPYCAPSPATDGTRIVAWFGSDGLHAWDLEGNRLWSLDLGPQRHQWGYASSPVLLGDRVYLNFGPGAEEFLVAVDAETGREVWRTRGPATPAEDTYGTWSSPLPIQVEGKPQLLVAMRDYFAGLDPLTGTEIWHCDGMGLQAKTSPIYAGGIALISGDLRGAEIAVRLGAGARGDLTETHRLWREFPPRARVATGVVRDGRVYGARANGILDCISLETGDVIWEERQAGPGGYTPIWASPILVGNLVYVVNQRGDTMIVEASPKYQLHAVNRLTEACNASPAIADGDLFLRTWSTLWCLRSPSEEEAAPGPTPASGQVDPPRGASTTPP